MEGAVFIFSTVQTESVSVEPQAEPSAETETGGATAENRASVDGNVLSADSQSPPPAEQDVADSEVPDTS